MSTRFAPPLFAWLFLFVSCSAFSQSDPAASAAADSQAACLQTAIDAAQKVIVTGPRNSTLSSSYLLKGTR